MPVAEMTRDVDTAFVMPTVRAGDMVWWSSSMNPDTRSAAIVVDAGARSLKLAIFSKSYDYPLVKGSVFHKDDPRARRAASDVNYFDGVWWEREDAAPLTMSSQFMQDLTKNVAGLVDRVKKLEKQLSE